MLQQRINDAMQNLNTWGGVQLAVGRARGEWGGGRTCCITEGCDLPSLIKDRLVRGAEQRSGGAKGHNEVPCGHSADAECAHHVVAAARRDGHAGREAERGGRCAAEGSRSRVGAEEVWERAGE